MFDINFETSPRATLIFHLKRWQPVYQGSLKIDVFTAIDF